MAAEKAAVAAETEAALRVRWRAAKAEAERLWYLLNRERVCAKRKQRYRSEPLYRQAIQHRGALRTHYRTRTYQEHTRKPAVDASDEGGTRAPERENGEH